MGMFQILRVFHINLQPNINKFMKSLQKKNYGQIYDTLEKF